MAPSTPGEPRPADKPAPIGSLPMMILFTICTACILFLLWKRADALKGAISYQLHNLKTLNRREGRIRLSEDDGPSAAEFLEDDYDHDPQSLGVDDDDDDEPLSERIRRVQDGQTQREGQRHGVTSTTQGPAHADSIRLPSEIRPP